MKRAAPRHRRGIPLLAAALLCAASGQASEDEYRLKAAFLLNFAKLVEWPAEARPAAGEPLVLGVAGGEELRRTLASSLGGAAVRDHPIEVRALSKPADVAACHIVFVSAEREEFAGVVSAARSRSALSVGEREGFATRGGVVNFFLEGRKLRFEINPGEAKRARLKISSRLLSLARLVGDGG